MKYWYTKKLNSNFENTIELIKNSMSKEWFWLLTNFNLQEIFKNKLNKDFNRYMVLGFCNPSLAFEAVSEDIEMWLFLPCNVIIFEKDNEIYISTILINSWVDFTNNKKILELSQLMEEKLKKAIDNI